MRSTEGGHGNYAVFAHMIEEIGEIARELYNQKSGRRDFDRENLAGEIADVCLLLAQLAKNFNIDLNKAVERKIKELEERAKG
ncbi:MAG: MazG nucleotide pyrophosphohydrolase domain-containing protein [Candidatus Syntropharchaeia archaeon]